MAWQSRPGRAGRWSSCKRSASASRPEQPGDEARVGATLAVAHPATLSRPQGARSPIPNPARLRSLHARWRPTPLRRPVPTRTRPSGNRRGRRQASPPRPEQLGDEARVGATLAVAHPESGTASFPSCEVASHALAASRTDPNEAIGRPARATTSVAPTPRTTRRRGPRRGDPRGRPSRDPIAPAGRAVAHPESGTASFPSYEVASHALAASRTDPNEAIGKPAWVTTSVGDHKRGRPQGSPLRISGSQER